MAKIYESAEELIGKTPLLRLSRLEKELGVKLFKSSGRNIVLTEYGKYLQKKNSACT